MARRVRSPSRYVFRTARGSARSTANMRSSAPRMSSSLFHMDAGLPSDLADERLAEDARRTDGKGEDEKDQPRGLAPSAPQIEAGDALKGAEEHPEDRKSTRLNSSHLVISYAVFCLKKKTS